MTASTPYESYFHVFRDIIRSMHSSNNLQEVLDVAVTKSAAVLDAKGALLRIFNEETERFDVRAACGLGENYLSKGPVSTEKVLSDPSELHRVKIISDIWHAPRVEYPQEAWDEGIRMMVDVPLAIKDQMLGLIRIYLGQRRSFSGHELDFMLTLAEQCACVIERVQLMENQKENFNYLATRMDKMSSLGRMAAGIAHEINNPLAGILLYSSNMRKKVPSEGRLAEGLDIIIKETQRCKVIIQGLLDFSRDTEPKRVPANLNHIVESALGIVENEYHLQHVDIGLRLAKDMVNTLLDGNQIEQVVLNLLLNALHAVAEYGKVTVTTIVDHDAGAIRVEVVDNGCGISQEHQKRIFEPFFSTRPNGTGLGLAISYGIVQNHQGDIRVSSDPGKGTRFVIVLPIRTDAAAGKGLL
ncbi:ATP-binding protein [uncultured Desulfosarcina sp.]|uniref:ATP-binding protein n=1 Tax=uncultured Desulfosarcina sp. TaxID=218289 RepID=UPI0029C687A4|nr:ATP-binding protein [uncultured Desulfosarcina sp.]